MDSSTPINVETLKSTQLGRTMTLKIAKPSHQNIQRILIMHDGQNLFSDEQATYKMSWNILDAIDIHKDNCMIVGIDCGEGLVRLDEYSPFVNPQLQHLTDWIDRPVGGLGKLYVDWIVSDLIQHLTSSLTHSVDILLGGSSMGGYISLAAMAYYPTTFKHILCFSSAIWFEEAKLLELLIKSDLTQSSVYMDLGTLESTDEVLNDAYLYSNRKVSSYLKEHVGKFRYREIEKAVHNERAWAMRIGPAFTWMIETEAAT